ncbi:MAG: methyltransferase domain-containing protein [Verrucomicrobiae bacterium]|nr:methyltransferase domain-containing protein [Verrucomicrobiae bacterium]
MHHLSAGKPCCNNQFVKPRRFHRATTVGLVVVGAGISIHLFAIKVSYWWLPLVVVLVLAHAAIISGIAWLVTRRGRNQQDTAASCAEHDGGHSHVLHNPRAYDWLARVITFGGERKFRQRTLALAELQPGDAVLDVGCGTGTLLIQAAKRVGSSGSAHGVDRSVEMLAHARHKAAAQGVTASFVEGSADHLAFPDASFDVVFCTLMLHHLSASMQMATVTEMRRVLRPGGRLIIVDMQRPSRVSAVFSHIGVVHLFRLRATLPDWQKIEERLTQDGVYLARRNAIWGETVCALVGRIDSSTTAG